jgi:hypothetical protein
MLDSGLANAAMPSFSGRKLAALDPYIDRLVDAMRLAMPIGGEA